MKVFFYIFFSVCFLVFLFLFLTRKYVNPYKLIMIFGKKGSGKSTTLTKLAITHFRKGWTVYSTEVIPDTYYLPAEDIGRVQLVDFNYKPFNPDDYSGFSRSWNIFKNKINPKRPKILLLVDEVGMIWDNRNFKNFRTDVRDFFKLQRHYHVKCVLFSQTFDIDKKLRDLTDSMFLQKNLFRVFTYGKKIKKTITINNNTEDGGKLDESFEYEPFLFFFLGSRTLTYIPKWSKYFRSFDAPQLAPIEFEGLTFTSAELPEEACLDNGREQQ